MTIAEENASGGPAPAKPPRNRLLQTARLRLPSPAGAPRPMSRQELAQAVNHYLWATRETQDNLDRGDVGAYERGEIRWPSARRREAFRAVLGATNDHELGFYTGKTPQPAAASPAAAGPNAVGPSAGRDTSGKGDEVPIPVGQLPQRRNGLFWRARLALPSPSGSGGPMSRAELAEAVNAYLAGRGIKALLTYEYIVRYERGPTRWPGADYRLGLRAVLGAQTDAQLGLFKPHRRPSNEEPLQPDEPGGVR